jgi:hypothetical protein
MDSSIDRTISSARRIPEIVDRVAAITGLELTARDQAALTQLLCERHQSLPLDFTFFASLCDCVLVDALLVLIHERHVECARFHQQPS